MNVKSPHKCWYTLKSVVFGSSSSLPLLVSEGGGLVCKLVGKADLLLDHFDSEQSKEAVDLPLIAISLLVLPPLKASLVRLGPLWWHWPIRYVSLFLKGIRVQDSLKFCKFALIFLFITWDWDCMSQCMLHAVLQLQIGILMSHPAAEPCSTAGLFFPSQCSCGKILLTQYSMVWDWQVSDKSRVNVFLLAKLLNLYYSLLLFSHLSSFCQ